MRSSMHQCSKCMLYFTKISRCDCGKDHCRDCTEECLANG